MQQTGIELNDLRDPVKNFASIANADASSLTTHGGKPIRRYAIGTNFAPGGRAIVGEDGPEMVTLPRGAKVSTAQETSKMGSGVTVNINSPRQLNPVEIARELRMSMRQLSFQGAF